ncbi:MAG: metallophosphoesterase [Peptoniphilus sp.]|nr:metallophosphoesterase [Peptoniphilus sp.]MDD7362989.1 metallophosphoesterase [Bacillota bacterium]MDY6044229.1 metallophosphoesterase [Peptoniphilus sp.]
MKFLYFTDSHIRGTNPKSRTDSFFDTVMAKIREIKDISEREGVDYILHGGDLFDRPDVSISVINDMVPVLQSFTVPIYAISGNHDIYGHNPVTLPRTMMGLLDTLGIIHIINNERILLKKDDTTVQLSGSPYIYGLDREENRALYILKDRASEADFAIHLVHGFLMPDSTKAMFAHTTISDILETKADLTISGHLHDGFPLTEVEGKYFVNPGSIVRISNTLSELKRRPKVLLIDVVEDTCSIREYFLESARPGDDVLDRTEIEMHKFKRRELAEFKESIESTGKYDHINYLDVIVDIAKNEKLDKSIKDEALRRIAEVEERRSLQ